MPDAISIAEFLKAAPKVVSRETFGEGEHAFEVEFYRVSRSDLEDMRKKAVKRVADRTTRQMKDEPDLDKLRVYLRDHCLSGWSGLTYGKLAILTNRGLPNGPLTGLAELDVPVTPENALALLEEARGRVNGTVLSFEDWVWEQITGVADERAQAEDAEKKI